VIAFSDLLVLAVFATSKIMRLSRSLKIFLVVFLLLFVGTEALLRYYIKKRNAKDAALWGMLLYSSEIRPQPNREISFRLYGLNSQLLRSADTRLNNMGLFSHRDYSPERTSHEFRIVVIGGEQTASSVVNKSWPDILEEELNKRDATRRYAVFNIAWPDAGPEHYIKYWKETGKLFSPDLVIVNYVETDFFRGIDGSPATYQGQSLGLARIDYRIGPNNDDTAYTYSRYVHGRPSASFREPSVIPSRPYGFFASQGFIRDSAKVKRLQEQLVEDMIAGVIPPFGGLTLELVTTTKLARASIATYRNFDSLPSRPVDKARMVSFGVTNFGWLAENIPNLVLTHNFNYGEIKDKFEFTSAMQAANPNIRVLDMRTRIPPETSDEELRSWYMIPDMGEKWSDKGHQAYARMMSEVILEWQSKGPRIRVQLR
jgi:hypothetical protein